MTKGILYISPKTAKLTRNTDFFSKMDPYVVLTCGDLEKKTRTHNSGGKNPQWDDTLKFKVNGQNMISISVYDEDLAKDDHVGSAVYNIDHIIANKSAKEWIDITHKNKKAGQIYIDFEFITEDDNYGIPPGYAPSAPSYGGGSSYSYPASQQSQPFSGYQPSTTPPAPIYVAPSYGGGQSYSQSPSYAPSGPSYAPSGPSYAPSAPGYGPSVPTAGPWYSTGAPTTHYMQSQPVPAAPYSPSAPSYPPQNQQPPPNYQNTGVYPTNQSYQTTGYPVQSPPVSQLPF